MKTTRLFDAIDDRVSQAKEDGDSAYFFALTLKLEYITKLVTSGVIACIGDDVDRQRYALEYDLVRADSIGQWVTCLHKALVGQPARLFRDGTQDLTRDLTQRVTEGVWQRDAVTSINKAAAAIGVPVVDIGHRSAIRHLFDIGVALRNRSRGHGAPTAEQCSAACSHLATACDAVVENLKLFGIPWVHLRRNLSGKYRVSRLLNDASPLNYLKGERTVSLLNGDHEG